MSAVLFSLMSLAFVSLPAIGAGGLTCFLLRQPWGFKQAFLDAVLGNIVALAAVYGASLVQQAHGASDTTQPVALIFILALAGVAARHIIRFALRPHS